MPSVVGAVSSSLQLSRSTQSGQKIMLAASAWRTVYLTESNQPFIFVSGEIDLTTMSDNALPALPDVIVVRVSKRLDVSTAYIVHDTLTYTGTQPVGHKSAHIAAVSNVYGIKIEMQQTQGVLRAPMCEFYDARFPGA